ncbi:MAG TPA: UDP-3-O-(3-hydroxymyristoyl)glucosamine N-acyltransferase, partial [Fibrobacter sp.]|nr:UDP-3-O-(3-hydroxymyristoyl)glucosamine N-acyltransferase [Fibrobacter sp.]
HLTIQKEARIAAKAGVTKNVARGVTVSGFPAVDINSWRKQVLFLRKMGRELK